MINLLRKIYNIFYIQRPSRFTRRIRVRLLLALFILQKILNVKSIRTYYGGINLIPNWIDKSISIYYTGAEGDYLVLDLKRKNKEFYFLDVGANIGFYSILAAKNNNCKLVYAFEPVTKICNQLKKNTRLNGCDDKVFVIEKAISNVEGKLKINFDEKFSGHTSIERKGKEQNSIDISSINYMKLNTIDIQKDIPIMVKIDTEGHELVILEELFKSNIGKAIAEIFCEVDERWVNPNAIKTLLEKNGFLRFDKIIHNTNYHYDIHAVK